MKIKFNLKWLFVVLALFLIVALTSCSTLEGEAVPFFEGYTWETLIGFFFALFFGLLPGFNLFQWLKDQFGLKDHAAHYMVLAVSLLLTVAAMLVTGFFDLTGYEFTLKNVLYFGGIVYAGSQIAYKKFKAGKAIDAPVPE